MNKAALPLLAAALSGLAACGGRRPAVLKDPASSIRTAAVERRDLTDFVPAYGIVVDGPNGPELEANVEAADAPRVRAGEDATAYVAEDGRDVPAPCRVRRILRGASAETGGAIAWLAFSRPTDVPLRSFLYAHIRTGEKRGVLTVPLSALYVRAGREYAVVASTGATGVSYAPRRVETGLVAGGTAEIVSGLSPFDRVVVAGGLGFVYADFKAAGGD
ncbi:MAG: hypothetical protein KGM24_03990 [Elusimicrobia bacterium]|nr:hypothetical protein [Elusimicrobiota bacterium]